MYTGKTHRERWADWVGCIAAIVFCVTLWKRASVLGILLAPTLIHNLVIAAGFLMRGSAKAKVSGFKARFAAYAATFLVPAYAAVANHWLPPVTKMKLPAAVAVAGGILWLAGCLFGVWGAWNLRYSFSIEPQARRLVTSGPYRLARHPIYTAYLFQYAGIFLLAPGAGLALILMAWYLLVIARIRFEERVLTVVFPEYVQYRQRVGMFAPRLMTVAVFHSLARGTEIQAEPRVRPAVN